MQNKITVFYYIDTHNIVSMIAVSYKIISFTQYRSLLISTLHVQDIVVLQFTRSCLTRVKLQHDDKMDEDII